MNSTVLRFKFYILACLLLCLCTVSCTQIGDFASSIGGRSAGFKIVALSNQNVVALSADDVIQVMRRAGFSDQQILALGTQLRNALLYSGAAQAKLRDKVEAVFAVHGDYVFITTRLRGSFIYDAKKQGWVKLGPTPQEGS
jgi:hypothetical protein